MAENVSALLGDSEAAAAGKNRHLSAGLIIRATRIYAFSTLRLPSIHTRRRLNISGVTEGETQMSREKCYANVHLHKVPLQK